MNLSVLILAGGKSQRMGCDKAWVKLNGKPLLARMVTIARELEAAEIVISGRPAVDYSQFGCPILLDREPGFGPVAGIERGLQATRSPFLLVLAVDLPRMTVEFLRRLTDQCDGLTGTIPQVAGKWEPLAAVYPKRCHGIAFRFLQQKHHSARAFTQACLAEQAVREYTVSPPDAACFLNCNTPADLQPGSDLFHQVPAGTMP